MGLRWRNHEQQFETSHTVLADEPLGQHAGTGCGNYRGLLLAVRHAGAVSRHHQQPVCMVKIEVINFSSYAQSTIHFPPYTIPQLTLYTLRRLITELIC